MREVKPKDTTRAYAFDMWMKAPMPMVTFFKTLDVSRLVKVSKKKRLKFNMLMCWCIGKAASHVKEFFMLPIGDKLIEYDTIAVNTIVANSQGEVSSCDIPFPMICQYSMPIIFGSRDKLPKPARITTSRTIWLSVHPHWRSTTSTVLSECIAEYSTILL